MQQKQNQLKQNVKNNIFTIGIIYNGFNADDISFYKEDLIAISQLYPPKKLRFVVFGYVPANDKIGMLDGLEFEYLPPVSTIHWPKQLDAANINLLFVPLINDVFNNTSEVSSKYLDAGILNIPVLAPDITTYQALITDQYNGYLYPVDGFKDYLIDLLQVSPDLLTHCGNIAHERIKKENTLTPQNTKILEMSLKTAE